MESSLVLAANFRAIGLTVAAIVLVGFVALFIRNMLEARAELGSEIELAANKKPYLSDEDLEGVKLDRSLSFALVVLGICSLSLPFYWLAEPGRQEGAVDAYQLNFESRGGDSYRTGAQCVNCHAAGGVGGSAPYVLQDGDGQFVANASWMAPALNDVLLRYTEEEVRYVLNYGRPGSPMAAWGTPGGGPLTTQQVDNIIHYLGTLQVQSLDPIVINESDDPVAEQAAADELREDLYDEVIRSLDAGEFSSVGEAVFNLGLFSGYRSGSVSCGRCHTAGWSLGPDVFDDLLAEGVAGCGGGAPSGIGYNLCNSSTKDRFPDDTWKMPDGSWYPEGGLTDGDGRPFLLSMDGQEIFVDEKGIPTTGRQDSNGASVPYLILPNGDLADCMSVSNLWEPDGVSSASYPYDPATVLVADESLDGFVDPSPLTAAEWGADAIELADGRLAAECEVIDMPERTSRAHFDFVYTGAEAGQGYGASGQSHAGMMPGFGDVLPVDLIQAVVDYERGL